MTKKGMTDEQKLEHHLTWINTHVRDAKSGLNANNYKALDKALARIPEEWALAFAACINMRRGARKS